jgi:GrpB-like predicted nucleotidyltransferase (UPF0157 family)
MSAPLRLSRKAVRLVAYDDRWPYLFDAEVALLRKHLDPEILDVAHIGSTAIPGLDAKPVLDLLVGIPSLRAPASLYTALAELGYEHRPLDTVADRLYFARGPPEQRTHNLSACERGSRFWRVHIQFRDRLRTDPSIAQAYVSLKRQLAQQFPFDRLAYTDGKESFVERIVAESEGA